MFKDQPLFKLGYSKDILMRSAVLGARFDLKTSCLVSSNCRSQVVRLERSLKKAFKDYQEKPVPLLPSGSNEVFKLSIFPLMIQFVESFQRTEPEANYQITRDISAITRKPPPLPTKRVTLWIQGMRPEWLLIPAAMRVFSLSRNFILHHIHKGSIKAKRHIVPGQKKVTFFVKFDSLEEFMNRLPDAEAR